MSEPDEAKQEIDLLDSSSSPTPSAATTSKLSTYRYNTRSSAAASSSSRSNKVFSDSAIDAQLKYLLDRETELQLQINELTEEIAQLQAKITSQDSSTTLSGNGKKRERGKSVECGNNAENYDDICWEEFEAPEWCVPIKADVLTFEWDVFAKECQFDVILMDPPWQLATHAPTRGVAIAYQQLPDICIEELPIPKLQKNGFLFIWQTVNRRMAKGHGFYLQHAKETCLMGRKGKDPPGCKHSISSDVIFSERRGQSQKPEELYEMIEELVPNGNYLEIFGRKNNLRDYW
ncbi:4243_t:CDS:2, partial [Dentiscutata erythropus]